MAFDHKKAMGHVQALMAIHDDAKSHYTQLMGMHENEQYDNPTEEAQESPDAERAETVSWDPEGDYGDHTSRGSSESSGYFPGSYGNSAGVLAARTSPSPKDRNSSNPRTDNVVREAGRIQTATAAIRAKRAKTRF
jgi:hypothetical protein